MPAAALLSNSTPLLKLPSHSHRPNGPSTTTTGGGIYVPVRCGPRDNRGPLVKGRKLSTEAIQAIQALKRSHNRTNATTATGAPLPSHIQHALSRLIKSDLLAALRELLRQGRCDLALRALAVLRAEHGTPDLSLYAEVAAALARNGMGEEMDALVDELEREEDGGAGGGIVCGGDDRALARLLKVLFSGERRESTVRIYRMMRRGGWEPRTDGGDHVARVLIGGLRRLGEEGLGDEAEREFGALAGVLPVGR